MATQTIFTEHLTDLLHAAMSRQQTGLLSIEHPVEQGIEKGEIYLEGGKITLARTRSEVGEKALARIQSWKHVHCTFFEGIPSPAHGVSPALAAAASRRVETDSAHTAATARRSTGSLQAVPAPQARPEHAPLLYVELAHPGFDATFRLLPWAATPQVMSRMERRERIVFMLLDGRRSVRDVARLTHLTEVSVAHILVHLLKNGYVEYLQG